MTNLSISKNPIVMIALSAALSLSAASCLKTRAQLREDGGGSEDRADAVASGRPVPSQVQDVKPEGGYVLDEIKSEITRMNGRIEDMERSQKQSEGGSSSKEDLKKLDARISELEKAQAD